jgi:hypothetical protein
MAVGDFLLLNMCLLVGLAVQKKLVKLNERIYGLNKNIGENEPCRQFHHHFPRAFFVQNFDTKAET